MLIHNNLVNLHTIFVRPMRRNALITLIFCMLCLLFTEVGAKPFVLVIDAGHGGHDSGALGAFSNEKTINLRTALAFGKYVEKNCPDVKVIYTRKTDVFVTLKGRAEIANKAKADLFVSIHTNAQPPGYNTAKGMETYTLGMHRAKDNLDVAKRENSVILVEKDYQESYQGFDPNSAESYIIFEFMQDNNMQRSVDLAKYVQKNTCSLANRPNKGVKQAGFLVLRETSMPSCLIELGFISTPAEEQLLNDEASIDNIAKGIYNAFVEYKKKYGNNIVVPYKSESPVETTVDASSEKEEKKQQPTQQSAVKQETKKAQKQQKQEKQKAEERNKAATTVQKQEPEKKIVTPMVTELEPPQNTKKAKENTPTSVQNVPIFKVQIIASEKPLAKGDYRFKGRTDYQQYKENGMTKYTIGASADYNEIYNLRKELVATYPDCFIIAFKGKEKMNINEAIKEYKANRNK